MSTIDYVLQAVLFIGFIALCLVGFRRDATGVPFRKFIWIGAPLFLLFLYLFYKAPGLWYRVALSLLKYDHPLNWNEWFKSIPYNDGLFLREWYHSGWLDYFMRWVYNSGFYLSLWVCLLRSFVIKDTRKMLQYALSGHVLQFPLILIFYQSIMLQEVWFVLGRPDLLLREWPDETTKLMYVMNCMPSMHTSIAFAMMMVAWREKDKLFRRAMTFYCCCIIVSTVYLQIHWLLDLAAGIVFAYMCVKLTDAIMKIAPTIASLARNCAVQVRRQWRSGPPTS